MSTETRSLAEHGRCHSCDACATEWATPAAAFRLTDAWIAAAQTWLQHGSPERALAALKAAERTAREGLRCCEALHGSHPQEETPLMVVDVYTLDFVGRG